MCAQDKCNNDSNHRRSICRTKARTWRGPTTSRKMKTRPQLAILAQLQRPSCGYVLRVFNTYYTITQILLIYVLKWRRPPQSQRARLPQLATQQQLPHILKRKAAIKAVLIFIFAVCSKCGGTSVLLVCGVGPRQPLATQNESACRHQQ